MGFDANYDRFMDDEHVVTLDDQRRAMQVTMPAEVPQEDTDEVEVVVKPKPKPRSRSKAKKAKVSTTAIVERDDAEERADERVKILRSILTKTVEQRVAKEVDVRYNHQLYQVATSNEERSICERGWESAGRDLKRLDVKIDVIKRMLADEGVM